MFTDMFYFMGKKMKQNIGCMVLKLYYKRASTCLYQEVRFSLEKKNGAICFAHSMYQWSKKHVSLKYTLN